MQQDADFITADFLYMFRVSRAHHQEYKILTRQPPVQVVMVAGGSSLRHIRDETLKDDLLDHMNQMFLEGTILDTQKQGMTVCLPKTHRPVRPAEHRPLCSTDYVQFAMSHNCEPDTSLCKRSPSSQPALWGARQ